MLPLAVAAFVAGTCLLQTQASLPNSWLSALLLLPLLILLLIYFYSARKKSIEITKSSAEVKPRTSNNIKKYVCIASIILLFFGTGFFNAAWRAEWRLESGVPQKWQWKDITVEGTVKGFADVNARRTRFVLDITRAVRPQMPLSVRAQIAIYHHDKPPPLGIIDGTKIRARVRIRSPIENINPGGFDYAGYLFARNILAAGYVRGELAILKSGGGVRESLRKQLYELPRQSGSLAALIVGDRARISDEQWDIMRRTGTAHLLSISGTHITLASGFAAILFGWFWRRKQRLTKILPSQQAALLAAVVAATAYAWLAGFGVPVLRSLLMFAAAAAAFMCGGAMSALQAISIAALLVTAADPWAVLAPGFWLSFLLAAAVVYAAAQQSGNIILRLLYLQLLVSLSAVPLTLWFFGEASLISPLANAIAVPFIGMLVLPLALADVLLPGDFLWQLCGWLLDFFWVLLAKFSNFPYSTLQNSAPWWLFMAAVLGAAWVLFPRGVPLRWCGLLPITAMILWSPPLLPTGAFRLTTLDIGQGTAVIIETRNHIAVYDTGAPHAYPTLEKALRTVSGNRSLDKLIISHDDIDHSGAAARLLRTRTPQQLLAVLPPEHSLIKNLSKNSNYLPCRAGLQWQWDLVNFSVLHPTIFSGDADNADSCVIKISTANESALLTGDIPSETEKELIAAGAPLSAAVLLVPHHGSRYSSSAEFLQAVSPQLAIFSAGAKNNYKHPHPDALQRTASAGAAIYRTDTDGAIIVDVNDDGISIIKWRDVYRRYWQK